MPEGLPLNSGAKHLRVAHCSGRAAAGIALLSTMPVGRSSRIDLATGSLAFGTPVAGQFLFATPVFRADLREQFSIGQTLGSQTQRVT
jgi:hypothetical protein